MDLTLHRCKQCDRIIPGDSNATLCEDCFARYDRDLGMIEDIIAVRGKLTPTEIANETLLPIKRIREILEQQKVLANNVESDELCTMCKANISLPHAAFCLSCQLAMYKSLGDEANLAAQNDVQPYRKPNASIESMRNAMAAKRDRAGFNRYSPNPSVKGNRKR